jgi:dipeptidyl aminopeptidase/acylaminoacyl peptidase
VTRPVGYGAWTSPITAERLVEATVGISSPWACGRDVFWSESRPSEGGRVVPVRRSPDGTTTDLLPAGWSARTLVHEYGGLCTAVSGDHLLFSNFADQRIWRVNLAMDPVPAPEAVTREPPGPRATRYADFSVHPSGAWLVAVRERHGQEVINDLVLVDLAAGGEPAELVGGHDFFSAPRLNPAGSQLAWLSWDHPNMPWDGTVLRLARLDPHSGLTDQIEVAGGPSESVSQPRWSPDGTLYFLSDRNGWWNLYRLSPAGQVESVIELPAEMGEPDWALGQASFNFLNDGRALVTWHGPGGSGAGLLGADAGLSPLELPYTSLSGLAPYGGGMLAVAGSPRVSPELVFIKPEGGTATVLRRSREEGLPGTHLSMPRHIEFPGSDGAPTYAWFYPPTNPDHQAPAEELPPLVVLSHGGPTAQARTVLNPQIQYLTSRGLAVVDVDYGGSTGYGRSYRQRLGGRWGIVDVEDCTAAASWLVQQGLVDGSRLAIKGGSAGGYTTLAALTFTDAFSVGASHYGVADVAALARDTHKFESRYLDGLLGVWPQAEDLYRARSPIHHTERLNCPIILFQGDEDMIVPLTQAEMMAEALRAKGLPFSLMVFEGEQHGFRRSETVTTVARCELAFFGRVFGFRPAEPAPELRVENERALPQGARGTGAGPEVTLRSRW